MDQTPVTHGIFRIHRYPAALIDRVVLDDGRSVLVRPVLPQDAELQQRFVRELSPQSRYRRFHSALSELSGTTLDYLTQVDYASHLALLAETFDFDGEERQVAEARYVRREPSDGDHRGGVADFAIAVADFAIAVADDWQGHGLGSQLLNALVRRARTSGIRRLEGSVLADNDPMRALMHSRGWRIRRDPEEDRLVIASLDLALEDEAPLWRAA